MKQHKPRQPGQLAASPQNGGGRASPAMATVETILTKYQWPTCRHPKRHIASVKALVTFNIPGKYEEFLRNYEGSEAELGLEYGVLWEVDEVVKQRRDFIEYFECLRREDTACAAIGFERGQSDFRWVERFLAIGGNCGNCGGDYPGT